MRRDPDADTEAGSAPQFNTEPADEPWKLGPSPNDGVTTKDLQEPAACLDDAGNEIPDQSIHPDDLPEVDMDRPLRVPFGKVLQYAPFLMESICCRGHREGTQQLVPLPKVGPNTPYPSSLKGTPRGVHRHHQRKDLTTVWAAAYWEDQCARHTWEIAI